jgi:hypothetical protein
MMHFSVRLFGSEFEPKVLDGFVTEELLSIVSPGMKARNGKQLDYGVCVFRVESISHAARLIRKINKLPSRGEIESIVLELNYEYEAQCNIEFDPGEIALIHSMGASLAISCYRDSLEA